MMCLHVLEFLCYASNMLFYASATLIGLPVIVYILMFLWFVCLRFRYSGLDYSSGLYYHAFFYCDSCLRNQYDSTMNNFDSEYPCGNFLEDSKFDELSEFLQSHCQKKNAGNNIAESNSPMHSFIFWCGWDTKSIHTIFSYIFTSLYNYMRCGKTLSYCFFKQSNHIYRGVPATLDNIKTDPDFVIFMAIWCLST